MSFEFVREVDREEDRRKYLELKARREKRFAMRHPPKVEAIEDFRRVLESLRKYGQRDDLVECDFDAKRCTIYGVESITVDREEEKAEIEVDRGDYEKTFFLSLKNLMDISVHKPASYSDVIYERRMGGDYPLKRYPDYEVSIPTDRGKCFINWKTRGPWKKESPHHKQGFEVYCVPMEVDEILEKFRERRLKSAEWRLKKLPGEPVTEEELRKTTKMWAADWMMGSKPLEELIKEVKEEK